MVDGFVRVAAATPHIRVADPGFNAQRILALYDRAVREEVRLLCLPELCLTGYTCGDLFFQDALYKRTLEALRGLVRASEGANKTVLVVGAPVLAGGKLYNCALVIYGGRILGAVPKTHLPNYGEFYELRHFNPAPSENGEINLLGQCVPFGTKLLFQCRALADFCFGVEICEDLWAPDPPGVGHALSGATLLLNLSASDETAGKADYRRALASGQSGRLVCAYVYADAGPGESTTDMSFAGHDLICENGVILAEAPPFGEGWAMTEIDFGALAHDRRRMNTFGKVADGYQKISFAMSLEKTPLSRAIDPHPFIPAGEEKRAARCEEILSIQSAGLAGRLAATGAGAVLGISGGLDSCLALLVACRAVALLGRGPEEISALTMPCFGTSERTRRNAEALCRALGTGFREIDITAQVRLHLEELGHGEDRRDVVYENAQARVRTLVLMNLANETGSLVIGTGDLSELALGWATYNGDHMSMYGVNAGVPKTLVRHLVRHVADSCGSEDLKAVLLDILDTPVSPELLPPDEDGISQKTEELVGPYELHDFFLYHLLRRGRSPSLILRLALDAFRGVYEEPVIRGWLKVFIRRFFTQQFKRSCLPDGPKVGSVTLSPRGDWRMPSDASFAAWMRELED